MFLCDGKYPIEITEYPSCTGSNKKFRVTDEEIVVYTQNVKATIDFYVAIGFKITKEQKLELLPFMEHKKVVLKILKGNPGEVFLDKHGFGSLAFVVDRIEKYKSQLEKQNFLVTNIEKLMVNGKDLKICFATNEYGDIVEFIGVK